MGLNFKTDWNNAAGDYAKHRAGFADWFFDRMEAAGLFRPGMRVLDLATGTGTLARGFAKRGGIVTGLDIAPEMMAQAKALDAQAGVSVGIPSWRRPRRRASPQRISISSPPGPAGSGSTAISAAGRSQARAEAGRASDDRHAGLAAPSRTMWSAATER